jgi:hypothetical protein
MLKKIKTSVPKSAQIFCKPRPVRAAQTMAVLTIYGCAIEAICHNPRKQYHRANPSRQTLQLLINLTAGTVKTKSKLLHCRQDSGVFYVVEWLDCVAKRLIGEIMMQ